MGILHFKETSKKIFPPLIVFTCDDSLGASKKRGLLLRFALQSRHRIRTFSPNLAASSSPVVGETTNWVASDAWHDHGIFNDLVIWLQTCQTCTNHLILAVRSLKHRKLEQCQDSRETSLVIQAKWLLWTMEGALFYAVSEFHRSTSIHKKLVSYLRRPCLRRSYKLGLAFSTWVPVP